MYSWGWLATSGVSEQYLLHAILEVKLLHVRFVTGVEMLSQSDHHPLLGGLRGMFLQVVSQRWLFEGVFDNIGW